MTRNQMIVKIALEIATQAVKSDRVNIDLSWLDAGKILESIEEDMKPKDDWENEH